MWDQIVVESGMEGMMHLVSNVLEVLLDISSNQELSLSILCQTLLLWMTLLNGESNTSRYGEKYDGWIIASHKVMGWGLKDSYILIGSSSNQSNYKDTIWTMDG